MTKKRPHEAPSIDTQLVEIYEDLANEDEEIRLKAASALLSKSSTASDESLEQDKIILKRLFRGLCSSRKAARLGFSVALTELLSQVFKVHVETTRISTSEIVDTFESQTAKDGKTSGQDERDHFFGKVFGAEAVVRSGILLLNSINHLDNWARLLNIICGVALKKPWLRQECGWLIYSSISSLPKSFKFAVIDVLNSHQLVRTPEGVAIWLELSKSIPASYLQPHLWQHGHPLSADGASTLANIMKDAKSQIHEPGLAQVAQGSAMWNAQLHFAWGVVLHEFYESENTSENTISSKSKRRRLAFNQFWQVVIDESLFASSSSVERKHWGFSVFAKVLSDGPTALASSTFTPNAVNCLKASLSDDNRYLKRSAQRVIRILHLRIDQEPAMTPAFLRKMVALPNFVSFETVTKMKMIERLAYSKDLSVQLSIIEVLREKFLVPGSIISDEAFAIRKYLTDLLVVVCNSWVDLSVHPETAIQSGSEPLLEQETAGGLRHVTKLLVELAYLAVEAHPTIVAASRKYVQQRIMACIERALKHPVVGRALLRDTVTAIAAKEMNQPPPMLDSNEKASIIRDNAFQNLNELPQGLFTSNDSRSQDEISTKEFKSCYNVDGGTVRLASSLPLKRKKIQSVTGDGLVLLYQLSLLQLYNGEPEAVGILEDLNSATVSVESEDQASLESDMLIEILLSFASKPSKLLRRISLQAFETLTPQVTSSGIEALVRVLLTKESARGQEEIFEAEDTGGSDAGEEDDVSSLDSDVEITDLPNGRANDPDSTSPEPTTSSPSDASSDEDENSSPDSAAAAELAAFDAALAAALNTRPATADLAASDTSGSSTTDGDMSDSAMEELDSKLADVFRAQRDLRSRKQIHREAKTNIVHFKNRVLDLVDVYLKREGAGPLALDLVLPLLRLARSTGTKQLGERALGVLREFCGRARGVDKTPQVQDLDRRLGLLQSIHEEAEREASNTHAAACSAASILVVKALVQADKTVVERVVGVYEETRVKLLKDRGCRVRMGLFTEWNNWCEQKRGFFGTVEKREGGNDRGGDRGGSDVKGRRKKGKKKR